jgi:hypothetical protein
MDDIILEIFWECDLSQSYHSPAPSGAMKFLHCCK